MTTENEEPQSHQKQTVPMPTEKDKSSVSTPAAAVQKGLPALKTPESNIRPVILEVARPRRHRKKTRPAQATKGSSSLFASKSGNSTDSSDKPLARSQSSTQTRNARSSKSAESSASQPSKAGKASRSQSARPSKAGKSSQKAKAHKSTSKGKQPEEPKKPKFDGRLVRSVTASCGCLYMVECRKSLYPSHNDLHEAGFPLKGRCQRCHVLVTEIRINEENGKAEVTEIVLPGGGEERRHGGFEDVQEAVDIHIDDDDEDKDESDHGESSFEAASQL
ncbi:unnamed protein product [Sordaria macrospora k-hell]|uniref:WGS project CABT00000000 data, contig 2.32 n=2 Tax=Sordaria macrospora TaxID=5147 RepID=F7W5Z5_SORMK|nr:uncharacterized protein SMAC_06075 [Sordaria macrospora k-hell]KAH7628163.1 hypothetical protein B0T09DRAFT_367605 [Sordaria sp. MPI-SDFR-AT-0083]CCC12933.1 unnamed protein product [Sordaria macrospora k-hell]